MKFGLRLIGYLGNARELVRLAVLGEQAGFDYVWFPHDTFMGNTWAIAGAVAVQTSRIRIGSVGTNPYTTNPAEIAKKLSLPVSKVATMPYLAMPVSNSCAMLNPF